MRRKDVILITHTGRLLKDLTFLACLTAEVVFKVMFKEYDKKKSFIENMSFQNILLVTNKRSVRAASSPIAC